MTITRPTAWCRSLLLGLSVLCLPSVLYAKDAETYPSSGSLPFLGLDDTSAPTQAQDGRAQDLQNVKLSISKDMRQRYGDSLVGTTQDLGLEANCVITGLYYTKFSSGTERIISTCGTRWNYLNGTSWTTVSGITVTQTAGANNQFVFTTALDEVIATNGVDLPIRYNGTTLNTVNFSSLTSTSRPTKAKTTAFFKNFLIFCNDTENGIDYKTRCRWSNVGTSSTWSDADYIDIGALGGQEVTALAELYDNLYVFLTDSIYRVSFVAGADTFNISKVTDDIGCIAKNSVQSITLTNAQNGLIFLDKDKKLYFFNGIVVQDISTLITAAMGGLSASRLQYAVSADSNTDYFLCLTNGTGGTNNLCLDLQYQIGEWSKYTNVPANAMAHVLDPNGRDQVYFGTDKSFVYQLENTSLIDDVGSALGTINAISTIDTTTASGLTVLYTTGASYVTGAVVGQLAGAPIVLTDSAGVTQTNTLATNTTTGLVMTDAFASAPSVGTTYEVGAIDSFYTTKWYDLGTGPRLKHFSKVYFWAADDTASGIDVSYASDFSTDLATITVSMDAGASDALWGSAIWGTSLWGSGGTDIFRYVDLTTGGRYLKVKWDEDDPGQTFRIYNWNILYNAGLND